MAEQPKPERKNFNETALGQLRMAGLNVLKDFPEIANVAVVLSFTGELNDSHINRALWLSSNGPVRKLNEVMGSLRGTVILLGEMFARAVAIESNLRNELLLLGQEILEKKQELEKLNATTPTKTAAEAADPELPARDFVEVSEWPDVVFRQLDGEIWQCDESNDAEYKLATGVTEAQLSSYGYKEADRTEFGSQWCRTPAPAADPELPARDISWPDKVQLHGGGGPGTLWDAAGTRRIEVTVTRKQLIAAGYFEYPEGHWQRRPAGAAGPVEHP